MGAKRSSKDLAKFLSYVLGRRPDEFGLVTDPDGFVTIKELLKAIHEEEGWRYVRRGHLDEVLISIPDSMIEIKEDSIRAIHQDSLIKQTPAQHIPKMLYTCIKQKSYTHVMDKGILPNSSPMVIVSSDREMAERIGKRHGPEPVLLTINTQKAIEQGVFFFQAGETIFTAKEIPTNCFTGPPVQKPKAEKTKIGKSDTKDNRNMAGSFLLEFPDQKQKRNATKRRRKEIGWKEERKKMKKGKYRPWTA